jgi:hypothetical protein
MPRSKSCVAQHSCQALLVPELTCRLWHRLRYTPSCREGLFSETPIPPVASPNPLWSAPLQHLSIVTSVYPHKPRGLLRTWTVKGAAERNHAAPTCLREEEQPGGASRRGGGKEVLQEIRRRPHVGPSSRSVPGQITHGRGDARNA